MLVIKLIGQGRLGSFKFFTLIATEVPAERVQQVAFYGEAFVDDDVADPPTVVLRLQRNQLPGQQRRLRPRAFAVLRKAFFVT